MTDQIAFPPLHDLSPGEIEMRKRHLLSEIGRDACGTQRRRVYGRATEAEAHSAMRRTRYAVAVAVLAGAAAGSYVLLAPKGHAVQTRPGELFSQLPSFRSAAQPYPPDTEVSSADAADAVLPYKVVFPSGMTPTKIEVGRPSGQLLAYFDTSGQGSFELAEQPTSVTVQALQAEADGCSNCGTHKVVVVQGVHVLVLDRSDNGAGNDLFAIWLRGDGTSPVLTSLNGPVDAKNGLLTGQSFSEQSALSVAASIISQGG